MSHRAQTDSSTQDSFILQFTSSFLSSFCSEQYMYFHFPAQFRFRILINSLGSCCCSFIKCSSCLIDRFTNIYSNLWMFLPPPPPRETYSNELHCIPLSCNLHLYSTLLGFQVACITCCYVGQTSGKLSGCQEQPLFKRHA